MLFRSFLALSDAAINEYLDGQGFPEKFTAKAFKEDLKADKIKVQDIYEYTYNGNNDLFDTQVTGAEVYRSEDAGATWKRTHADYLDNIYFTYVLFKPILRNKPNNQSSIRTKKSLCSEFSKNSSRTF